MTWGQRGSWALGACLTWVTLGCGQSAGDEDAVEVAIAMPLSGNAAMLDAA